ncbi:hypothetical protein KA012_02440 [Candidatus Woesebacteria bacterium]|nr:hypothetical protein [Candidatus Woesebacteria bacterium]
MSKETGSPEFDAFAQKVDSAVEVWWGLRKQGLISGTRNPNLPTVGVYLDSLGLTELPQKPPASDAASEQADQSQTTE